MAVFDSKEYRQVIQDWIQQQPNGGYGAATKIARAIDLNPSILSLVLKGEKHLTIEQAWDVSDFLKHDDLEREYFTQLVLCERAVKQKNKLRIQTGLEKIRDRSRALKERMPPTTEMNDEQKSVFYSRWFFSGVRILTSIEQFQKASEIAEHLAIPRSKVNEVLEFLCSCGLVRREKDRYVMGPQSTHLGKNHHLVFQHHTNWRQKALEKCALSDDGDLFFTSPLSLSQKDFDVVKRALTKTLKEVFEVVDPSPSEVAACLNLDFFKYSK